ncbi:CIC11C00000004596 [Sungouiella intermedia]|uniref:CIC11C00000004596 n=1 Tax=Sungouiella intermedia TaxID=45354 RepID=A0A1L0BQR0_9ASCO|nr:CIC11C00000004596 [[Candida] intermedia]
MVGELREKPAAECPICSKKEYPKRSDLLCGNCVHDLIEIIRNSVVENERANSILRNDINVVFAACEMLCSRRMTENDFAKLRLAFGADLQPDVIFNDVSKPDLPFPRLVAVKNLAFQLQKLDTVNIRSKIAGIQATHESLQGKVESLEEKVKQLREQIARKQNLIVAKREELSTSYMMKSDAVDVDIFRIQGNGMKYVLKQAVNLQVRNYQVLKDIAFPNYENWKLASGTRKAGKTKLELFGQPIIQLPTFLSNNKLETINMFLENLIYLQVLLHDMLTISDNAMDLPYLDTLKQLLPDSNFFDLVQKKFSFIVNDPETLTAPPDSNGSSTPASELDPQDRQVELAKDGSDKIVIKNNVIHIPISFRTVNLQRRVSLKSPEKESFSLDTVVTSESNEETLQSPSPKSKTKSTRSLLKGKQIVIVPHKILTKPFTRLLSKEYLRFLLVIVKIVLNFQVLLKYTLDKVPENRIRRQSSGNSLTNTINQLRFSGGLLSSVILVNDTEKDSSVCDFEAILARIADMEPYFKYLESEQLRSLERERISRTNSLIGPTLLTSTSRSALTQEIEEYFDQDHSVCQPRAPPATKAKVSRIRGFYDSLFGNKRSRKVEPSVPEHLVLDQNIYGLVSETYLENSDNGESKSSESFSRNEASGDSTIKKSELNPRAVMTTVHQLIAQGNGGSRAQSLTSAGDDALKLATLSMLEESRHQLDDWDVLSRMY